MLHMYKERSYCHEALAGKAWICTLLSFCLLLTASCFSYAIAETYQHPQYNAFGQAVLSESGERINYPKSSIEIQKTRNMPVRTERSITGPSTAAAAAMDYREADWKYFIFGAGIGDSNITVSTYMGVSEIVTGGGGYNFGGNRYWFLLRHNPATGEYEQSFVSPVTDEGVTLKRIISGDFAAGGSPEIITATDRGLIRIWDQAERTLTRSFKSSVTNLTGMYAADIDNDGKTEIILCNSSTLYVYSMRGVLKWLLPGVGGNDVIAAQMDSDPALEIATTDGSIVDGISSEIQWSWPAGFGFDLEAGDIDGDGYDELIAAESWYFVWAFDIDAEMLKWSIPVFNTGAISLGNIDEDDTLELIVGENQWGRQVAFNTVTLRQEWEIINPGHGTTDVAFGDVDGDGINEIIWGAGHSSTGPDNLFVGDWTTETQEWSSIDLGGPFRGTAKGDVDGDGILEIVTVTNESNAGYGAGRILVFDTQTQGLQAISQEVSDGLGWSGTHEVKLRNVDSDASLEIVVSSSTTYDGTIEIYDYDGDTAFTRIWQIESPLPEGAFRSAEIIDIDSDGKLEVIGGAEQYIYVYDLETGLEEWHSIYLAPHITKIAAGNTDKDSSLEIICLGSNGNVYILDGKAREIEAIIYASGTSLQLYTVPVQPAYILVGNTEGGLSNYHYESRDYLSLGNIKVASGAVDGFTLSPGGVLLLGSGGHMSMHMDWGSAPMWVSESYGSVLATSPSIFPAGTDRRAIAAGSYGLISIDLR